MDVRDMEAVVAIADRGSFTAAAQALFVAQPSLSKRIAALESSLGTVLFERTTTGAKLTAAGEAFVIPARAALGMIAGAQQAVDAVHQLRAGLLTITALPTIVISHVVPLVSRFQREHPLVDVRLLGAETARSAASMVASGRADLALCASLHAPPGTVVEPAFDQELVALLPPGTDVPERAMSAADLVGYPIAVTTAGTSTRQLVDELFERAALHPRVAVETDQRDALIPLVLAGTGVTFVSEPLAANAEALGAVVRRVEPALRRPVMAVTRAGTRPPALAAFVDAAQRRDWRS
jgi:DNA-binding transcriptional LysR family regulator